MAKTLYDEQGNPVTVKGLTGEDFVDMEEIRRIKDEAKRLVEESKSAHKVHHKAPFPWQSLIWAVAVVAIVYLATRGGR